MTLITASAALSTLLTAREFEEAVYAAEPRVAVFDCDGTLWARDSGSAFLHWSIKTGLLAPDAVAWLNERYRRYLAGEVNELVICGEMVQVYEGLRESDVRSSIAEFFPQEIEAGIFPELRRVVTSLQASGTEIWAVSSTNDWVVEEGVKRFGIAPDHVLAARVAIVDGIITDRLLDVPTDEGKVAALARVGVTGPCVVFGNSIHDAAMLAIARRAFPINPSPGLLEHAGGRGWPVFFPGSTAT